MRYDAADRAPPRGEALALPTRLYSDVQMLDHQPEAQRFRHLTTVQGPVEAEVWLAPG